MSWDIHLVWHVVQPDGCVVGAWGVEAGAATQARDVGGTYQLVANCIAGWGARGEQLVYAPRAPVGERTVLAKAVRGEVEWEHPEYRAWLARIGVTQAPGPAPGNASKGDE